MYDPVIGACLFTQRNSLPYSVSENQINNVGRREKRRKVK